VIKNSVSGSPPQRAGSSEMDKSSEFPPRFHISVAFNGRFRFSYLVSRDLSYFASPTRGFNSCIYLFPRISEFYIHSIFYIQKFSPSVIFAPEIFPRLTPRVQFTAFKFRTESKIDSRISHSTRVSTIEI